MSTFQIFPCKLVVPCDTFQCHGRATYFLGREDSPKSLLTKLCDKCANELVESMVAFKEEVVVNGDPIIPEPLPFDDPEITVDGKPIDELSYLDLKRACKNLGITGYSDKNKEELIGMITEATNFVIEES